MGMDKETEELLLVKPLEGLDEDLSLRMSLIASYVVWLWIPCPFGASSAPRYPDRVGPAAPQLTRYKHSLFITLS